MKRAFRSKIIRYVRNIRQMVYTAEGKLKLMVSGTKGYYGFSPLPPGQMPQLTSAEERKMFLDYHRTGDLKKKEILVRKYLCWALKIAMKLQGPRLKLEEATGAANGGLMEAIEKFKPGKNLRFTTYSYFIIRRHVVKALLDTYPVTLTSHFRKKVRTFDTLEAGASDLSTGGTMEIAAAGVPEQEDSFVGAIEEADLSVEVKEYVKSGALSKSERAVLVGRHYCDPALSFEELENKLKLPKATLRRHYAIAVSKLKKKFNPDGESKA